MKLDEKYFVPFLAVVAIVTALLILFFTINNQQGREQEFKARIAQQDSLKQQLMPVIDREDSLSVRSLNDQFVILDFWATWTSSFSIGAHEQLSKLQKLYPDRVQVVAAVVEDKPENIAAYINQYDFSFNYVDGTQVFNQFGVPGVPTQIIYAPDGELKSIFTGYADSTRFDSLKAIISDE